MNRKRKCPFNNHRLDQDDIVIDEFEPEPKKLPFHMNSKSPTSKIVCYFLLCNYKVSLLLEYHTHE